MTETVVLGCDHAGVTLKNAVIPTLKNLGYAVLDIGTSGTDSVDYPDFADKVAAAIGEGKAHYGIVICGSGIGISIAANRHRHIRAALCHNEQTATLARQHNNANVLALGARTLDEATALTCVKAFFTTEFEGGRHQRRVDKLS